MTPSSTSNRLRTLEQRLEAQAGDEACKWFRILIKKRRKTYRTFGPDLTRRYLLRFFCKIKEMQDGLLAGHDGNLEGEKLLRLSLPHERMASLALLELLRAFERQYADDDKSRIAIEERWLIDGIANACLRDGVSLWRRDNPKQALPFPGWVYVRVAASHIGRRDSRRKANARYFEIEFAELVKALNSGTSLRKTPFWGKHQDHYRRLAGRLLNSLQESGIVDRRPYWKRSKDPMAHEVALSAGFDSVFRHKLRTLRSSIPPRFRPMVFPPRPWLSLEGDGRGGYLDLGLGRDLVETGSGNARLIRDELERSDLTSVFKAVNALQDTRWRINPEVLRAMHDMWRSCRDVFPGLPGVPLRIPKPKTRNKQEWAIYYQNERRRRIATNYRAIRMPRRFQIAKEMGSEVLYFPHYLDFRGRAYPLPRDFHPQDDDIGRALIDFADGKVLGMTGRKWLARHLANMWGLDRKPFSEREKWVRDRSSWIVDLAKNPLAHIKDWSQADKPWRFLAACFEWRSYLEHRRRGAGRLFVSHVPVAVDGTCNSLQHLSALARDRRGGAWSNLVPSRAPSDLYAKLAAEMSSRLVTISRRLQREFKKHPDKARKVAKAAAMPYAYGVDEGGLALSIADLCAKQLPSDPGKRLAVARKLARLLLTDLIPKSVPRAAQFMEWFQEDVATRLKDLGKPKNSKKVADEVYGMGLRWRSSLGFPVVHEYRRWKMRQVETSRGALSWPDQDSVGLGWYRNKQKNAVVANFVHSLDAAHMMMTILLMLRRGRSSFGMVHDSYAVHAADVELLGRELRTAFIRLHSGNVLEEFRKMQATHAGVTVRRTPRRGRLDIRRVRGSRYFFC